MDFGSKVCESKEYSSTVLRENYNSNNSSKFSTPSQIVDELRKNMTLPPEKILNNLTVGKIMISHQALTILK